MWSAETVRDDDEAAYRLDQQRCRYIRSRDTHLHVHQMHAHVHLMNVHVPVHLHTYPTLICKVVDGCLWLFFPIFPKMLLYNT